MEAEGPGGQGLKGDLGQTVGEQEPAATQRDRRCHRAAHERSDELRGSDSKGETSAGATGKWQLRKKRHRQQEVVGLC